MATLKPFKKDCSSRRCEDVAVEVKNDRDRREHPHMPPQVSFGGVRTTVLEAPRVLIRGEQPKTYTPSQHGMAIEFARCRGWKYTDRQGDQTEATCTEKKRIGITERTVRCYSTFSELLGKVSAGKKGAPPTRSNQIISLLGCSNSNLGERQKFQEPITNRVISTILHPRPFASEKDERKHYNQVRKTVENLIVSGKVVSGATISPEVLYESQHTLTPEYQKIFDDFIATERDEQRYRYLRTLFGEKFVPAEPKGLPEAPKFEGYRGGLDVSSFFTKAGKRKKVGKKKLAEMAKAEEEWRRRTMIAPPRFGLKGTKLKEYKIKKAPKKIKDRPDLEYALGMGGHL